MKVKLLKIICVLIFAMTLIACTKDEETTNQNVNGKYSGIFTVEYLNGTTFSNPVTINFNGEKEYNSSGNGNNNDFYPAGGNGTYEKGEATIVFYDTNHWLANFDWNLILNGSYNYVLDGDKLVISADKNNIGLYKYELLKE